MPATLKPPSFVRRPTTSAQLQLKTLMTTDPRKRGPLYAARFHETGTLYSESEHQGEVVALARIFGLSPARAKHTDWLELLCGTVTAWPRGPR